MLLKVGIACCSKQYLLPDNYDKSDPPETYNQDGQRVPVQVRLRLTILDFLSIKEFQQEIVLDVVAVRYWVESRLLTFNVSKDSHEEHPLEEEESINFWKPPFYALQMTRLSMNLGKMDLSYLILSPGKMVEQVIKANTVVKCDFYFGLFPLDIQKCNLDFMTPLNTMKEVDLTWHWTDEPAATLSDLHRGDKYLLPEYEATLFICNNTFLYHHVAGNVSSIRLWLILKRQLLPHFLELYVPTGLFVVISWGSFLVKPDIVPGRMVLLVTNLLSLVTLFEASRKASPPAIKVKVADIWVLSCIVFVFLALLEYAFILFSSRSASPETTKSKNNLDRIQDLKLFSSVLTINHGNTIQRQRPQEYPHRFRCTLRNLLKRLVAWLRNSSGSWTLLDKLSLVLFPAMFTMYNMIYWNIVLSKREMLYDYYCPEKWEYVTSL